MQRILTVSIMMLCMSGFYFTPAIVSAESRCEQLDDQRETIIRENRQLRLENYELRRENATLRQLHQGGMLRPYRYGNNPANEATRQLRELEQLKRSIERIAK